MKKSKKIKIVRIWIVPFVATAMSLIFWWKYEGQRWWILLVAAIIVTYYFLYFKRIIGTRKKKKRQKFKIESFFTQEKE